MSREKSKCYQYQAAVVFPNNLAIETSGRNDIDRRDASPNGEAVRLRMVKKKFNISFDLQYIILYIIIEMQYIISGELKWRETN